MRQGFFIHIVTCALLILVPETFEVIICDTDWWHFGGWPTAVVYAMRADWQAGGIRAAGKGLREVGLIVVDLMTPVGAQGTSRGLRGQDVSWLFSFDILGAGSDEAGLPGVRYHV